MDYTADIKPDLVAFARMNPGFLGDLAPTGTDPNAMVSDATGQDNTLMFESILDDLHFNQSNFILM